ncbi:hypothetical protein [Paraburkholderia atlantica]|uniref:hypothetical protein n=1 Tax=Paraburkholderia atlantica TaxID=2654982 RepID=UPI003D1A08BB
MGEIADDHIDYILSQGMYPFARARATRRVTCDRCGARGLRWRETDAGWRLHSRDGLRHDCNPPSEDDFDVIEPE